GGMFTALPSADRATADDRATRWQGDRVTGAVTAEPESKPASEPAPIEAASGGGSVRVAAEKLDAFLSRNGELLVARRRVQLRAEDLRLLREFVGHWTAEWHAVEKRLGKWLELSSSGTDVASPTTETADH